MKTLERFPGKKSILLLAGFFITTFILSIVQLVVDNPLILAERFLPGAGWIEILIIGLYTAFVIHKMKDPAKSALWRQRTWLIFTIIFFLQLIIGLVGFEKFLMTGKLHLPVPAMIISGPIYRGQIGFMTILFLSTIIISGPVWCSHLCYFGAIDGIMTTKKNKNRLLNNKNPVRNLILIIVILTTIVFRTFNMSVFYATVFGLGFGIITCNFPDIR